MSKVSVIVPVYNAERYLGRCVESILNQTYTNIEIILIDDGSPDKCPVICDSFAKEDQRIIVIHKKNGGVSSARNAGMRVAKGEYITFIDGDDWVDSNYVSYLLDFSERDGIFFLHCLFQERKMSKKWKLFGKNASIEQKER